MTKDTNKSQRDIPLTQEVANHKKKTNKQYLKRADHKHQYKTVHLHCAVKHFEGKYVDHNTATKVCSICGRVGHTDDTYYKTSVGKYLRHELIEEKVKDLEDWSIGEPFAKFATKGWEGIKIP